jgi:hypothetical protein
MTHLILLVKVLDQVEQFPVAKIPKDSYGFLTARDGAPLAARQFIAEGWDDEEFSRMLDARYFLGGINISGKYLRLPAADERRRHA